MVRVLVGVHRTAEHEYSVVGIEWARWRHAPAEGPLVEPVTGLLDNRRKELGSRVCAVDHRKQVHDPTLRLIPISRRWPESGSCRGAVAAAARWPPPGRSGRAGSEDPPTSSCC